MTISGSISNSKLTIDELLFQPIDQVFDFLSNRRHCPVLDDLSWLRMGIRRVLDEEGSGRGFLQVNCVRFKKLPTVRNYFHSLCSPRRMDLTNELNLKVLELAKSIFNDRLADLTELDKYEVYSMDGHWHRGATHGPNSAGSKVSTGHFYALDMRRHLLRDLGVNEYPKENDMHVLKRLKPTGLRHGVARGNRVLNIYDRAGIDFDFWRRCQKECAVYFLSRVKEGMVFERLFDLPFDKEDPRNAGIQSDEHVHTTNNHNLRIITYIEPESGEAYEFLTNVTDVPPGVLAEMYRRRWEIEKVFDDLKNKLFQQQSWSSDQIAKKSQGQLISLAYNLIRFVEEHMEREYKIINEAEERRQAKQREKLVVKASAKGRAVSSLLINAVKATQRSVKLIRWLRGCLRNRIAVKAAAPHLALLYASL
jgi:hypothetical protein